MTIVPAKPSTPAPKSARCKHCSYEIFLIDGLFGPYWSTEVGVRPPGGALTLPNECSARRLEDGVNTFGKHEPA